MRVTDILKPCLWPSLHLQNSASVGSNIHHNDRWELTTCSGSIWKILSNVDKFLKCFLYPIFIQGCCIKNLTAMTLGIGHFRFKFLALGCKVPFSCDTIRRINAQILKDCGKYKVDSNTWVRLHRLTWNTSLNTWCSMVPGTAASSGTTIFTSPGLAAL